MTEGDVKVVEKKKELTIEDVTNRVKALLAKKVSIAKIRTTLDEEKISATIYNKALSDIIKKTQDDLVANLRKKDNFLPDKTPEQKEQLQKTLAKLPPRAVRPAGKKKK